VNLPVTLTPTATILLGALCVIIGLFAKKFYGPNANSIRLGDPVPVWFGRIGFIAIGILFIWIGIKDFSK
jgi:hypothetical protein